MSGVSTDVALCGPCDACRVLEKGPCHEDLPRSTRQSRTTYDGASAPRRWRQQAPRSASRPLVAGVSGTRLLTVLIVDDDPRVRAALVRLLDEVGDVRSVAVDTEQAMRLSTLIELDADVAVVDVPGPGNAGEALVARWAVGVPVVAMSLSGSMQRRAVVAGASWFVEKDGDDGALVDAIRAAAAARSSQNVLDDLGHASRDREEGHRDD